MSYFLANQKITKFVLFHNSKLVNYLFLILVNMDDSEKLLMINSVQTEKWFLARAAI